MYAIIRSGGRQHRVAPGDRLRLQSLEVEAGSEVQLGEVLAIGDGDRLVLGQPLIEGASVKGVALSHDRDRKVLVFKKKRRKQYRRTRGHRQAYSDVRIDEIIAP
ncbi:MAG TPA: 50S ribosomal protein L21 [Acidobacteriota bacterium]